METSNTPNPKPNPTDAEGRIRSAHQILKALQGSAWLLVFSRQT
jgi:hypothetical protein